MMTPEEFATQMQAIADKRGGDPESAHGAADDLLCEALKSLGCGDGVAIFEKIEKWYA
jgi:hypothetical protein